LISVPSTDDLKTSRSALEDAVAFHGTFAASSYFEYIAIDTRFGRTSSVADAEVALRVALIVDVIALLPPTEDAAVASAFVGVTNPPVTEPLVVDHVTAAVTFPVEPSLRRPVAVNCTGTRPGTFVSVPTIDVTDTGIGAVTATVDLGLDRDPTVAVTPAPPMLTPLIMPAVIVAAEESAAQITFDSEAVVPSLNDPVAVNVAVIPTGRVVGATMAIDSSTAALTVTAAVAGAAPTTVAVIVDEPILEAFTTPFVSTVAFAELDDHAMPDVIGAVERSL
jgi:hypothetical protein